MTAATLTPDIKQATAKAPPTPAPVPARSSSPMPPHLAAAPPALSLSGGEPLAPSMRQRLETSYDADLGAIRVHTDPASSRTAAGLGTKAFAFGPHIVLGAGARADNLGLMAHEAAHTVQQRGAPVIQHYDGPGGDAHETEARRASEAVLNGQRFAIQGRTDSERPQGFLGIDIPDPLDWLANKANVIPGFRMFTIILGVNPINMSAVPRSAANILRALIEIMPGGGLITQALDNSGVFEKVGAWVEQQIATLGMVGSAFKAAITAFIDGTKWKDLLTDPGGVWDRAKRIFTDPIDRIKNFAVGLVSGIIQFVKDAILQPLAALASKTRAWDLLIAVLGKNPITGEAVPRTADTLIGGFMKLIGQEEVWTRIKSTGAIGRCWTWFQSTMSALLGFVQQIPTLAVNAFKSLELFDIVLLPRAFVKVGAVFANFVGSFISWAGDAVWKLLEIVFDVVSPGAWGYIKKTGAALKSILKNPLPFVGNLVKAAKLGFQNFAGNFGGHLKAGLIDWLTGSLPGVYIPKAFSLAEVGKFALSILGITWMQIRGKIVKVLGPNGEKIMAGLETAFDVVVALVRGGPAAAWAVIQEKLSDLKDTVVGGITDFVVDTVVKKAIPKLVGMFIPGAGFVSAIISIYDTVMVFVNKIAKIIQVVTAFIDSIVAIAGGAIGAAAGKVEGILAGLLSLAINFLAGFVGLGKVADKVMGVINKVRTKVDQAIDKAIAWIVAKAKALFAKLFGKKDKEKAGEGDVRAKAAAALSSQLGTEHTESEINGILANVLSQLRPEGLKNLRLGPKTEDGDLDVYAEASPDKQLLKLAPKGRKVRMTATIHLSGPQPVDEGLTTKFGKHTQFSNGQKTETLLPAALPPVEGKSTMGGLVVPPTPGAGELKMVAWNTGEIDPRKESNGTHAERQFVAWFTSQPEAWLKRVTSIEVYVNYSPCTFCCSDLNKVTSRAPALQSATLSWDKPYDSGPLATTSGSLSSMAKWKVTPSSVPAPKAQFSLK